MNSINYALKNKAHLSSGEIQIISPKKAQIIFLLRAA
jgi:hypothetical protein